VVVLVQRSYIYERGATASNQTEWKATNGTIDTARLRRYRKRPSGVIRGLSTAMYGVA